MRLVAAALAAAILRCLGVLSGATLFALVAVAPLAAQQDDLNAISKRLNELQSAGNYAAALVEAQKAEALVRARFGVAHANYGGALYNMASINRSQGKYADAEELFQTLVGDL